MKHLHLVYVITAIMLFGLIPQARAAGTLMVDYRSLYKQAAPGVVFIAALFEGNQGASGTGSIVTSDGVVLTNHHVIWDDKKNQVAPRIFIFLKPDRVTGENANDLKRQYRAEVLAYDKDLDLAALKIINPPQHLRVLPFMPSEYVEIGAPSAAIGHPEQGVRWTLTTGAISGRINNFNHVKGKDVFQMETSINRGNSGGPLLDHLGNIIAVNTMIARVGEGGVAITDINFAVQGDVAVKWLKSKGITPSAQPIAYEDAASSPTVHPVAQQAAAQAAQPATPAAQNPEPQPMAAAPQQNIAGTTVSKKEQLNMHKAPEKQKALTLKKNKERPKVVSKEKPGKSFTEDDFRKTEKELDTMMKEMEDDFNRR